ncbi:hypothetical protein FHW12_004242 [Dokdonella fugitiva]|uniref:Uncharacterized protein n=1 Tax=Dokdonella fugitiva TaxID=328517 RepID=A0A839F1K7_9GAMM|nr:hypothetical protein [Dokdonella fugitiva]MBA8889995.1 hypothetical protein [Dokdonella fugitiva]
MNTTRTDRSMVVLVPFAFLILAGCHPIVVKNPTGLNASLGYFSVVTNTFSCGAQPCDQTHSLQPRDVPPTEQVYAVPACEKAAVANSAPTCARVKAIRLEHPMRLRVASLPSHPPFAAHELPLTPATLEWTIPEGVWGAFADASGDSEVAPSLAREDLLMLRYLHRVSTPTQAICSSPAQPGCADSWAMMLASMNLSGLSREPDPTTCNATTDAANAQSSGHDRNFCAKRIADAFDRPLLEWDPSDRQPNTQDTADAASLCWDLDAQHGNAPPEPQFGKPGVAPVLGNRDPTAARITYGAAALAHALPYSQNTNAIPRLSAFGGSDWQFSGHSKGWTAASDRGAFTRIEANVFLDPKGTYYAPDSAVSVLIPVFVEGVALPQYLASCTRLGDVSQALTLSTRRVKEITRRCSNVDPALFQLAERDSDAVDPERAEKARQDVCKAPAQEITLRVVDDDQPALIDAKRLDLPRAQLSRLLVAPFDRILFDMR